MDQAQQKTLLQVLRKRQEQFGYLAKEFIAGVAKSWNIPESELHELVVSFPFLHTQPRGRNVIRVCKSGPCYLKGSQMVVEGVEKEIGIKPGERTPDGRFSFEMVNCIGACDRAPAMLVNHDVHGNLTSRKIARILKSYR